MKHSIWENQRYVPGRGWSSNNLKIAGDPDKVCGGAVTANETKCKRVRASGGVKVRSNPTVSSEIKWNEWRPNLVDSNLVWNLFRANLSASVGQPFLYTWLVCC